jgi:glycosyl transferase family 25
MKAFVINMPSAPERWRSICRYLKNSKIDFQRIEGIDGQKIEFPISEFNETSYRLLHGRSKIPAEIGCYLSHIAAMKAFLDSSEDFGIIMEDDAAFEGNLSDIIEKATIYSECWDILRLSSVNLGKIFKVIPLDDFFSLGISFTRQKGACAYVINRHAAEAYVNRLIPMRLPYDYAFDLEWFFGLKTLFVTPLPIKENGAKTQVQIGIRSHNLSPLLRYWIVFPFRVFMEISRLVFRVSNYMSIILPSQQNILRAAKIRP